MKIEKILVGARKLDFTDDKDNKIKGTQLFVMDASNLIDSSSVQFVEKIFINGNITVFEKAKELLCDSTDIAFAPITLECSVKGSKVVYSDILE